MAQRSGMDHVGPFFFNSIRMFLGALVLIIYLWLQRKRSVNKERDKKYSLFPLSSEMKTIIIGGIICGIMLTLGSAIQQVGLVFTTAAKAGFLTTLYILLVPILGLIFKQKTYWNAWLGVFVGAIGLYFLSITESLSMEKGDLIILLSALFWALHILFIGRFAPQCDPIRLSIVQFLVTGIISLFVSFFADSFFAPPLTIQYLLDGLPQILYVGIMSSGLAFTFQALGQRHANPTTASLILSLEAVFAAVFGFLILGEIMTLRELFGSALVLAAVILSQLDFNRKKLS